MPPPKHPGQWSNSWFEQITEPVWEQHLKPVASGIQAYLEIGVCEGRSMIWILENCPNIELCVGVDPWEPPREKQAAAYQTYKLNAFHNLGPYIKEGKVQLVEEVSQDWLRRCWDDPAQSFEQFDLIYLDGDHRGHLVLQDAVFAWPLLKPGGYLVWDDLNRRWTHGKPWVREAADAFLAAYESMYYWYFREPRQWAIKKAKRGYPWPPAQV